MRIHRTVFPVSALLILAFVVYGALYSEAAWQSAQLLQGFITGQLGWIYTVSMTVILGMAVFLIFSEYGDLRLGKPGEEPKYAYFTWFAMVFSAGIDIGLYYFGVAEPLLHYMSPPRASPETVEAARQSLALTIFHWGLNGWALYAIVGVSLAFFGYRKGLPLTFRSTLYPILGDRIDGPIGDTVEILAVFATMFGVATGLGLGVLHVNAGLVYLGWLPEVSLSAQLVIIALITVVATISVVTGLDRGIRRLSELNFGLGIVMLVFLFIAGPTTFLIEGYLDSMGYYLQNIVSMTTATDAYDLDSTWYEDWTLFYWGWWMIWSPFVGVFLAQISRGRTIREFVIGVLLVPTFFISIWMGIFGNNALYIERGQGGLSQALDQEHGMFMAFYEMLGQLPMADLTISLAMISGGIYFVTSSDSASLIIDILTSEDDVDPPVGQRIFWAVLEGAVAATLLIAGGRNALKALQYAAVAVGLPFAIVVLTIAFSLFKALRKEVREAPDRGEPDDPTPG
jgi:choline/glycine/proline betaine transport protein